MRKVFASFLGVFLFLMPVQSRTRNLSCFGKGCDFSQLFWENVRSGQKNSLSDFVGKSANDGVPILLIVWASYCMPCIEKMPSIGHLERALRAKNLKTRIVLLSIDPIKDSLCRRTFPLPGAHPLLWSCCLLEMMKGVASHSIPCGFLVDKNGQASLEIVPDGETWNSSDIVSVIQSFEEKHHAKNEK